MRNYFISEDSIDEIALKHHIGGETLERVAQKALMRKEEGRPWGFRDLLPGLALVDHTSEPAIATEAAGEGPDETVIDDTEPSGAKATETTPGETPSTEVIPAEFTQSETRPSEPASIDASHLEAAPIETIPTEAVPTTPEEEQPTAIEDISVKQEVESPEQTGTAGNANIALNLNSPLDDAQALDAEVAEDDEDTGKRRAIKVHALVLSSKAEVVDAIDLPTPVTAFCPEGRYHISFKKRGQ